MLFLLFGFDCLGICFHLKKRIKPQRLCEASCNVFRRDPFSLTPLIIYKIQEQSQTAVKEGANDALSKRLLLFFFFSSFEGKYSFS